MKCFKPMGLLGVSVFLVGGVFAGRQPAAHLVSTGVEDPAHPRRNFICGLGLHANSEEKAQANAKVQVSAQVQSELESVIEDVLVILDSNGIVTEREDYVSRSMQRSDFEHNELIEITETAFWKGAPGGARQRAYACLDRRVAGEQLAEEVQPLVAEMDDARTRAMAASKKGDLALFSTQYQRVGTIQEQLAEQYGPLKVISATYAADTKAALDSVGEIRREGARLRSLARIGVSVKGVGSSERSKVQQAFRQAFDALELDASSNASSCGGGLTHLFQVSADNEMWKAQYGGTYHCKLVFNITLTDCKNGGKVDGLIEPDVFTSSWNQPFDRDEQRGIREAWGKLDDEPLLVPLRDSIVGALPVD